MHGPQDLELRIKPGSKLRQEDKDVRQMIQLVEGLPCRRQDLSSDSPYTQVEWRKSLSPCGKTDRQISETHWPANPGEQVSSRWAKRAWAGKWNGEWLTKIPDISLWPSHEDTLACICVVTNTHINKYTCMYTHTHMKAYTCLHLCIHQHPH